MAYFVERSQVQYDGNVQLLAESGQLQADTLILSDSGESVEARGSVNHLILARHESYNQSGDGSSVGVEAEPTIPSGHVQVRSKRLDYLQKEAMIRYSGGVVLSYGDTIMSSEVVDAIMDHTGKRVERATAQGKINIQQDGREVKGERAEYFLEPGKFVVTGKSAQIYDPTRGRSFASRLTFFTSSDRILLDDGSGALRD